MSTENDYLELRNVNITKKMQPAIMANDRNMPILDNNEEYNIDVIRFDIDNRGIPIFVPRIEKPFIDLFTQVTIPSNASIMMTPWQQMIEGYYTTNLQCMIEYTASNGSLSYYGASIPWIPEHLGEPIPPTLDRQNILSSRFFHCHHLSHFASLVTIGLNNCVNTALNTASSGGKIIVDTLANGLLSILVPQSCFALQWRLIVNKELSDLMGFHTVAHETLQNAYVLVMKTFSMQILPINTFVVQPTSYGQVTEDYRPACFFPFKLLLFTSQDIQAEPLMRYNNSTVYDNAQLSIITDYLLDVTNITTFYDTITYQPQSYNRKIRLLNSINQKKLQINVLLETADGIQTNLLLYPNASCSILMRFSTRS